MTVPVEILATEEMTTFGVITVRDPITAPNFRDDQDTKGNPRDIRPLQILNSRKERALSIFP